MTYSTLLVKFSNTLTNWIVAYVTLDKMQIRKCEEELSELVLESCSVCVHCVTQLMVYYGK